MMYVLLVVFGEGNSGGGKIGEFLGIINDSQICVYEIYLVCLLNM